MASPVPLPYWVMAPWFNSMNSRDKFESQVQISWGESGAHGTFSGPRTYEKQKGDVMKPPDPRRKEPNGTKGKKDDKIKSFDGEPREASKVESQQHVDADEDTTGRMSFSIDFWLAEGEVRGKIIHRPSGKHQEFSARDQARITEFLNRYLSRLERSIARRPVEESSQPTPELAEAQKKMRTRSFGVFIKGTDHPKRILQKEQPFEYKWSFETPASFGIEGEELNCKVNICRKNLASGKREIVVDKKDEIKKETDFREPLIVIPSEPLSAGTYRLEGEANFQSLKSKKPESPISCKESCVILVV